MIPHTLQNPERPDPIQERVGLGIFTDREREMASLMACVEMAVQRYGHSQALVSHRRYKTSRYTAFYISYPMTLPSKRGCALSSCLMSSSV